MNPRNRGIDTQAGLGVAGLGVGLGVAGLGVGLDVRLDARARCHFGVGVILEWVSFWSGCHLERVSFGADARLHSTFSFDLCIIGQQECP